MAPPIAQANLDLGARAAALGITKEALRMRDKRRHLSRRPPTPSPAAAPTWIGVRIFPPIEPDHPALSSRIRGPGHD